MKCILLALLVVFAISCSKKKDHVAENEEEIIGLIKLIYPKSIQKDKEFIAKMFSIDSERKIVNAVVDCDDFSKIDSTTFEIQGCTKELLIRNDTVYLAFIPTSYGEFLFQNIHVLSMEMAGGAIDVQELELNYEVKN